MKRPPAWMIAAMLLAGCKSPTAAIDPFFGRQTVAPPATGLASAKPPDSAYYNNSNNNAPAGLAATPSATGPAAPSRAAGDAFAPPGGFGYKGGGPAASPVSNPQPRSPAPAAPGNGSPPPPAYNNNPPFGSTNPGERPVAATASASSGTGFRANTNPAASPFRPSATPVAARQIQTAAPSVIPVNPTPFTIPGRSGAVTPPTTTTVPLQRGSAPQGSAAPGGSSNSGGFRPISNVTRASYEQPIDDSSDGGTARASHWSSLAGVDARGQYGRDSKYGWLKGRLEYSKSDDRWKLRYIPIDGETDEFGGSVTLLGSRVLEEYEPGQFVTVYGEMGESKSGARDYAPSYRLDRVTRQNP